MVFIASNLKFLRKNKGLTQKETAQKVNITRALMGAWEEERSKPNAEKLVAIGKLFSITIEDFISKDLKK